MVFEYPNEQAATTLWYHDHALGMTRANVYAGPAGFYILRGGPGDEVDGKLPEPAPVLGDANGISYHEIPILIQDRSFNADGSLFYPGDRAFFEGVRRDQLRIPFIPDGSSDVSPIWNPEFFGNTMVVNGRTWPYLDVEKRRYRLRFLNGCDSRFLPCASNGLLLADGAEGGFCRTRSSARSSCSNPPDADGSPISRAARWQRSAANVGRAFGGASGLDVFRPNTTGQSRLRLVAGPGTETF
jgi:FtsP/CotA-like multicopper oxidase with cupredoxin domain